MVDLGVGHRRKRAVLTVPAVLDASRGPTAEGPCEDRAPVTGHTQPSLAAEPGRALLQERRDALARVLRGENRREPLLFGLDPCGPLR